jgi:transcription antitermination factor NusG
LVVQTKRHKERAVQAALGREGIPTYLPLLRQWPRPAVGGDVGPMFPGYVFCQPEPGRLSAVANCSGALRLVAFGDAPARVGSEVIAYLRGRAGADGVIEINPVVAGRPVTITSGPLRGLAAVVERRLTARQRVLVLLDLLHRPTRVELPEEWLRLA